MDQFPPFSQGNGTPMSEDVFNYSALMNIETFTELCNPSISDRLLLSFNYSSAQPKNGTDPYLPSQSFDPSNCTDSPHIRPQNANLHSRCSLNSIEITNSSKDRSGDARDENSIVPRSFAGITLVEKLLTALSLFKKSSGGGILAQVWMPMKVGDEYILSTSEQPYLLDQIFSGYREVSRSFTFSWKEAPGMSPGLPGRVFISGMPEWTSNIAFYHPIEYLRVNHALAHEVRGSLALPIFDTHDSSCCAVLELVTKKEKADFDADIDSVCGALEAVNLRSVKTCARARKQNLTQGQKSAFTEILDVLRVVCHAHMLPLALTWVPTRQFGQTLSETMRSSIGETSSLAENNTMLSVQESSCYVNDRRMLGFLHACSEHNVQKGQFIAGKAIQSKQPIFAPDVKVYGVQHYPFAHHARKFGLHAAVAIRVQSTFTGRDDYVLEFFLPVNCKGSSEQQLLLNNLAGTLQRICRSLRTVSGDEKIRFNLYKEGIDKGLGSLKLGNTSASGFQSVVDSTTLNFEIQHVGHGKEINASHDKKKSGPMRHQKKMRSVVEKNISLSVLQKYYSGTLKDAAKSIGVCPTTLKRICRLNGISRWPSRTISKVNHSMKKIETVINSVPGMAGTLMFDPSTGNLTKDLGFPEKQTTMTSNSLGISEQQQFPVRLEENCLASGNPMANPSEPNFCQIEATSSHDLPIRFVNECGSSEGPSNAANKRSNRAVSKLSNLGLEVAENMEIGIDTNNKNSERITEQNHLTNSDTTDSSSGSASSCPTSKKDSDKNVTPADINCGLAIRIKATYKEDTVRFKFFPSMGWYQLTEEIGKRFKLSTGTFQLKYLDDEGEWVLLMNNSDLQECVEILESMGTESLRIMVRDLPFSAGSSGSSNSLLLEP
ncbi:protein NLP2-like isoform X2 [Ananas comosus]|uniref:Protein NLP2-like isoform X2 n=1 Tax=Ananas comosus TaxID=4615 RepID=A0A6P5GAX1_ANACO|nr:protein NLP2-like isoform X2 [Ananas comosus]